MAQTRKSLAKQAWENMNFADREELLLGIYATKFELYKLVTGGLHTQYAKVKKFSKLPKHLQPILKKKVTKQGFPKMFSKAGPSNI